MNPMLTKETLEILSQTEADKINASFKKNSVVGLEMLDRSINTFFNLLVMLKGDFIEEFDADYKFFIVALLMNIDDKYKSEMFSKIVIIKRNIV